MSILIFTEVVVDLGDPIVIRAQTGEPCRRQLPNTWRLSPADCNASFHGDGSLLDLHVPRSGASIGGQLSQTRRHRITVTVHLTMSSRAARAWTSTWPTESAAPLRIAGLRPESATYQRYSLSSSSYRRARLAQPRPPAGSITSKPASSPGPVEIHSPTRLASPSSRAQRSDPAAPRLRGSSGAAEGAANRGRRRLGDRGSLRFAAMTRSLAPCASFLVPTRSQIFRSSTCITSKTKPLGERKKARRRLPKAAATSAGSIRTSAPSARMRAYSASRSSTS